MDDLSPHDEQETSETDQPAKSIQDYLSDYTFLAVIAGAVVALDQLTKEWVRTNIAYGDRLMPWEWLTPYARILHWRNTGAAFGMFQSGGSFFLVLGFIVTGLIVYYFPQIPRRDRLFRWALSFQLAGAIGNLIDRVRLGHVTDFISIGNFAVFNVADSAITLGTGLLLLGVYLAEMEERRQAAAQNGEELEMRMEGPSGE
jgi:signal peptidase II